MIQLFFFLTSLCFASEVLDTGVTLRHLLVSQEAENPFQVGEYVCVEKKGEEVACGFVQKAEGRGVILDLEFRAEDVGPGLKAQRALTRRPCDPDFKFRPIQDPRMEKPLQDPYSRRCTEEEKKYSRAFKLPTIHFFSIGTGILSPRLAAERALGSVISLGVSVDLVNFSTSLPTIRATASGAAYGANVFLGFYPFATFDRFFVQLSFGLMQGRLELRGMLNNWSGTVMGIRAGYRFLDWQNFGIGLAVGAHHYSFKNPEDETKTEFLHPNVLLEFGAGF